MRAHIEDAAGIKAYDLYGLTEIIVRASGASASDRTALHIFEDHFYPGDH